MQWSFISRFAKSISLKLFNARSLTRLHFEGSCPKRKSTRHGSALFAYRIRQRALKLWLSLATVGEAMKVLVEPANPKDARNLN
jgi:hypothetical protein